MGSREAEVNYRLNGSGSRCQRNLLGKSPQKFGAHFGCHTSTLTEFTHCFLCCDAKSNRAGNIRGS